MYANEKLMHVIWNGIIQAINAYNKRLRLPESQYVRTAIDNSDVELAKQLIQKYGIVISES